MYWNFCSIKTLYKIKIFFIQCHMNKIDHIFTILAARQKRYINISVFKTLHVSSLTHTIYV